MIGRLLDFCAARPTLRWGVYLGFAAVFFHSGLQVTTLLVEPEHFAGGATWAWVAAFPALLAGFFLVNRRLGCASGACAANPGPTRFRAPPGH
jgi:hypothetical protein